MDIRRRSMLLSEGGVIYYTSSDNKIVTPYKTDVFGANITNNVYINGQGIISFDGPVTTIGDLAFYNGGSLTSITIPDSVTSIGASAFYNCRSLPSVYCKATTPPVLDGTSVFANNSSSRRIYVPAESVDAYKSATNWSAYASAIVGYNF